MAQKHFIYKMKGVKKKTTIGNSHLTKRPKAGTRKLGIGQGSGRH